MESSGVKRGYVREDGLFYWKTTNKNYQIWLTKEKFEQYQYKHNKSRAKSASKPESIIKKREYNKIKYNENIEAERIRAIKKYQNLSISQKEEIKANKKRWYLENKSKIKASKGRRRERQKSNLSKNQLKIISVFYDQSKRLSEIFKIKFHVDHIFPLNLGGRHHPANLQVMPARLNQMKGSNTVYRWSEKN